MEDDLAARDLDPQILAAKGVLHRIGCEPAAGIAGAVEGQGIQDIVVPGRDGDVDGLARLVAVLHGGPGHRGAALRIGHVADEEELREVHRDGHVGVAHLEGGPVAALVHRKLAVFAGDGHAVEAVLLAGIAPVHRHRDAGHGRFVADDGIAYARRHGGHRDLVRIAQGVVEDDVHVRIRHGEGHLVDGILAGQTAADLHVVEQIPFIGHGSDGEAGAGREVAPIEGGRGADGPAAAFRRLGGDVDGVAGQGGEVDEDDGVCRAHLEGAAAVGGGEDPCTRGIGKLHAADHAGRLRGAGEADRLSFGDLDGDIDVRDAAAGDIAPVIVVVEDPDPVEGLEDGLNRLVAVHLDGDLGVGGIEGDGLAVHIEGGQGVVLNGAGRHGDGAPRFAPIDVVLPVVIVVIRHGAIAESVGDDREIVEQRLEFHDHVHVPLGHGEGEVGIFEDELLLIVPGADEAAAVLGRAVDIHRLPGGEELRTVLIGGGAPVGHLVADVHIVAPDELELQLHVGIAHDEAPAALALGVAGLDVPGLEDVVDVVDIDRFIAHIDEVPGLGHERLGGKTIGG